MTISIENENTTQYISDEEQNLVELDIQNGDIDDIIVSSDIDLSKGRPEIPHSEELPHEGKLITILTSTTICIYKYQFHSVTFSLI